MKKIVIFLVTILLVASLAVPAMAANSFLLEGPDVVRAGDTITITFYGGNLYKGAYEGSGIMVYDTEQLTLVGYTPVLGDHWKVDFFGDNFNFWQSTKGNPLENNVPIFTAEFQVNENLAAGEVIRVKVENVMMNNGEYDISLGSETWWRVLAEPLNANADLA